MMRQLAAIVPQGVAGQIGAIIVAALIVAQVATVALYEAVQPPLLPPELSVAAVRVGIATRLIAAQPPGQRAAFAAPRSGSPVAIHLGGPAPTAGIAVGDAMPASAAATIASLIQSEAGGAARAVVIDPGLPDRVFIQLPEGDWLSYTGFAEHLPQRRPFPNPGIVATLLSCGVAIAALSLWATRRVTAPLSRLAAAAERLGIGGAAVPVVEQGPIEVRRAARAFNQMQERLQRFVADRTRLLAAISHDLRTPLTRLRLRIMERKARPDQTKMLQDVTALEKMAASALAFIRDQEGQPREDLETVDLASLLQTLCDEFADDGYAVAYHGPEHRIITCRPDALARALRNLIDNAVRHAGSAEVRLHAPVSATVLIDIADAGPGIPDSEKAKVFEPFYRLDPARGSDTDGSGLGLAIARTTIRAHGGDIALVDNTPQGLVARVELPIAGTG